MMKIRIEWIYRIPKGNRTFFMQSEFMTLNDVLLLSSDLEKSGRLKSIEYFDQQDRSWTKKELDKLSKIHETEPQDVSVYVDGGYDKNTKLAGLGIVIYFTQHQKKWRIRRNEQIEYITDNNEAELAAMHVAMQLLEENEVRHQTITLYSDSQVAVNQASGEWPSYEENYRLWLDKIDDLKEKMKLEVQYVQIERKDNKEADQLANQALSGIEIFGKKERST
ncbi:reverse transcriptase-like protein [Alkalihalophilus lindianensis]|uniref:Reverse transcriptase-like protein n=1 Tax=Alkalihalophilus lindianensis TaxID=1630542 RepID=A0ABU3X7P0_9BACI|nr:reverse transcriptase-like protein [Alkalihalophilus lindianensis]MDV2683916.1 reverse transcriptase-like protein [Alkalihalophilus lindianensis]